MKIDIPLEVIESMKKIVDIYIEEEEMLYEESREAFDIDYLDENQCREYSHLLDSTGKIPEPQSHIYHDLELVNRFLHSQELQADIDLAEREF